MSETITIPLPTANNLSTTSSPDAPRVSLTETPVDEMSDEQLREFVKFIRERRTSQQLSAENKPQRRSKAEPSLSRQKQVLGDLLRSEERRVGKECRSR